MSKQIWSARMACIWQDRTHCPQSGTWTIEIVEVTCEDHDVEQSARHKMGIAERTDSEGRTLIGACLIGMARQEERLKE